MSQQQMLCKIVDDEIYNINLQHIINCINLSMKNKDNFNVINMFEKITINEFDDLKEMEYDIFCVNYGLLNDNEEVIKYFIMKKFRFSKWALYQCAINNGVKCYKLLRERLSDQYYGENIMDIIVRSDSINILKYTMTLPNNNYCDYDYNKLVSICEFVKSNKCLNYLKLVNKIYTKI